MAKGKWQKTNVKAAPSKSLPFAKSADKSFSPRIDTEIAGVHFANPVLTASGTFGYGREFSHLIDLNSLGGIVVKGISAEPMSGNPPPRIYETESGMLNAIGLANVGLNRFLAEKVPLIRTMPSSTPALRSSSAL